MEIYMSKNKQKNVTRISLIDWMSFYLTLGLSLILIGVMIFTNLMGWDVGMIGSVISVVLLLIFCTLLIDLAFILTACVTIGEGAVNAGKDEQGQQMIFHADKVVRIEVRDLACHPLPEDKKVYHRVKLTFIMESGRAHERKLNRLTQAQIERIREAVAREAKR